jgi:hypothetical protein
MPQLVATPGSYPSFNQGLLYPPTSQLPPEAGGLEQAMETSQVIEMIKL